MRGFNLEGFRTIAAAELQGSQSEGTKRQIGSITGCGATYLHRVWLEEEEGLFRAFIDAKKLEEFVLSSPRVNVLTVTNSGIMAYANPKDPPYPKKAGCCSCCGREIDVEKDRWILARVEDSGPFPSHSECWKKWYEANYPGTPSNYSDWRELMNVNELLFVKSLVQSINDYREEQEDAESEAEPARGRQSSGPEVSKQKPAHASSDTTSNRELDSRIFDLHEEQWSAQRICEKLDFEEKLTPQSDRCKWKHLNWTQAYKSDRFHSNVCKYISSAARRERKRRLKHHS